MKFPKFVAVAFFAAGIALVGCSSSNNARTPGPKSPSKIPTNNSSPSKNPATQPDAANTSGNADSLSTYPVASISSDLLHAFDSQSNGKFLLSQNCVQIIKISNNTDVIRFAGRSCSPIPGTPVTMITRSEMAFEVGYRYTESNDDIDFVGEISADGMVIGKFHTENRGNDLKIDSLCTGDYASACYVNIDDAGHITSWDDM